VAAAAALRALLVRGLALPRLAELADDARRDIFFEEDKDEKEDVEAEKEEGNEEEEEEGLCASQLYIMRDKPAAHSRIVCK